MADPLMHCPECSSEHNYQRDEFTVCSICGHEWIAVSGEAAAEAEAPAPIRDSVGNALADGDTVTVVKDLKVKGSATAIKVGTKVRNIRLVDGVGDHDIDCKVDGFGPMQLMSSVVKKV